MCQNGYTFYYYSIDSSNLATALPGELKQNYSLRIIAEGKEYTANTTIPDINKDDRFYSGNRRRNLYPDTAGIVNG